MTLFSIPDSWAWTTLGDIADVVGGVTKDSKKQSDPNIPLVPYLRVANVQRGYLDLSKIAEIRVPTATFEKLRLQAGDVLLNEGGDRDKLGRGWVWDDQIKDCIHQNHVFRARLHPGVMHPKLLAWFTNECAREWFDKNATQSVNLASISLSKIKCLPVPLPPLGEQERIVADLESHLSRLDVASRIVKDGSIRAKVLRRNIIDDADSRLADLPRKRLGELLREPLRNGHSARATQDETGIRTLTLTAVTSGYFIEKNTKVAAADSGRVRDLWLRPGDIFVQRSNTPELVGSSALYRGPENWAIFPDLLIRVRVVSWLLPEFVHLMLSTTRTRRYLRSSARGLAGSMPKIDQGVIERIELSVPSLDVQREFVEFVKAQQEGVSRLLGGLEGARIRSDQLRRSLLREAFAGRLLSQDPVDEPASELLARIRAEQAAQSEPKRARRTTPKKPPVATRAEWPDAGRTPVTYEQEELL